MHIYVFRCDRCNEVVEQYLRWPPPDVLDHLCDCGGFRFREPTAPAFAVSGFNAANHYGLKEGKKG